MVNKAGMILLFLLTGLSLSGETNILVLHSFSEDYPHSSALTKGLTRGQEKHPQVTLYNEYMGSIKLSAPLTFSEWHQYLQKKYTHISLGGIFADSVYAANYLNQYADQWPGVPKAVYANTFLEPQEMTYYKQPEINMATEGTVELALNQNPEAERVIIIGSDQEGAQSRLRNIQNYLTLNASLPLSVYTGYTREELIQLVQDIPSNSIIFFNLVLTDRFGNTYIPREVLEDLTPVSRAPIYTFWSSLLDTGIVGGNMLDTEKLGEQMIQALLDYQEKGEFQPDYSSLTTYLDWQVLSRYDIKKDLPLQGVIYKNKKAPFLKQYTLSLVLGLVLIAQSIVIGLFLYRHFKP